MIVKILMCRWDQLSQSEWEELNDSIPWIVFGLIAMLVMTYLFA
ncbi:MULTISPECIES: hypothetical protein [unclassified Pseudomonas]|nr:MULTISPECIES: hypothetical protein [unclassified Pseudomonas]